MAKGHEDIVIGERPARNGQGAGTVGRHGRATRTTALRQYAVYPLVQGDGLGSVSAVVIGGFMAAKAPVPRPHTASAGT